MITETATRRPSLDAALTEHETLQHPPQGTTLFKEGAKPNGIYVVHSGTVDLLFQTRSSELKRVRSATVGEILGLDSIVSCRPQDYTARVATECNLGFVSEESFGQMLSVHPELWLNVLQLLSQNVNASYDFLRHGRAARV